MAIPPLAMVLVFTPPVFAIVRDLTQRANAQLAETLARRTEQARNALLEHEFYVVESVRLAANVEGVPAAVRTSDAVRIRRAFDSVAALKDRLHALAATDRAGVLSVQVVTAGPTWEPRPGPGREIEVVLTPVLSTADAEDLRAGFARLGERTLFVVAGRVLDADTTVGAVIAAIDAESIVDEARGHADASVALYDHLGRRVAGGGDGIGATAPSEATRGRTTTVDTNDVSTLFTPVNAGGHRLGTLAVALPRAPAFALAQRVTRNLQLLLGLALLVALVLLLALTRFLLLQIRHLRATNASLAAGDLTARAAVLSKDELGQVARGFNSMADELEASYAQLEHRVEERTKELLAARDVAADASRAKASFLASMSHEIRTPMNAVIGMTSLLLDTPLDDRKREWVETIRTSGDHLLAVVNDVLDFSKIEAGRLELELHAFSLRTCVEEALDLIALRAHEKRLELAYSIEPGTPEDVVGDLGRLRQVLLNLLSNAVKFTEHGEVVVSIGARALGEDRYEVHAAVRDTGIGIARAGLDHLFVAFSQIDAPTTRAFEGTGLGLAISRALVELMGGRMWVESTAGRGSTFHFTVVARAAPAPEAAAAAFDLRGIRVLVADDSATTRRVASAYLRSWGMRPTMAASASRALQLLRSSGAARFQLCLLDEDMPEASGLELASRVRELDADVRVLLMGSVGGSRELSGPVAGIVSKPIKPSQLLDAVVDALSGRAVHTRAVAQSALDHSMGTSMPLRILVAEDNAVNQRVARAVLERLGYAPDFAADGSEAIDAVLRQPYDVVFMDVQMPHVDGLEATAEIRRLSAARQPRIVAMTASATAEDRRKCLDAGMDDYLAKPVTVAKLVEALGRCRPIDDHPPGPGPDARIRTRPADTTPHDGGARRGTRRGRAPKARRAGRHRAPA